MRLPVIVERMRFRVVLPFEALTVTAGAYWLGIDWPWAAMAVAAIVVTDAADILAKGLSLPATSIRIDHIEQFDIER